jgi:actin-related protein 5
MKRIQKMQKKAYLSRLEKREQTQKEKERILQLKQKSPEAYLISLYRNKKEIKDRLEKYKQLRKDMANRHSKSNLKRMQTLAELGKDTSDGGNNSNNNYYNNSSNSSVDDDFGKKDEDWDIYREVSRHNLSDKEEEDQQQLHEVEMQINEMDPDYYKNYQKYQYEFYHKHNELYLGVDQFRGPELMFKPSLIGIEQAGVTEIINSLMKTVDNECVRSLCGNIFLTGGNVKYKNIKERIFRELRMNTPCDVGIDIRIAEDPVVDAWKGGRDFCNDVNNKSCFVSREEYNECGCEYFKENRTSNCKVNTMGRNMNEIYNSQNVVSKKYKI